MKSSTCFPLCTFKNIQVTVFLKIFYTKNETALKSSSNIITAYRTCLSSGFLCQEIFSKTQFPSYTALPWTDLPWSFHCFSARFFVLFLATKQEAGHIFINFWRRCFNQIYFQDHISSSGKLISRIYISLKNYELEDLSNQSKVCLYWFYKSHLYLYLYNFI